MKEVAFIPPTKRRAMTKIRRTKIFLARNGRCYLCGRQIRDGEKYEIEHPEALDLGGPDDDADLWPVHVACHKRKTAADRKQIKKRNDAIDRGYAGRKSTSRPIPGSRASGIRKRMSGAVERWSD